MQNQLIFDTKVRTALNSFWIKMWSFFPDVLPLIAQSPAPRPGPSDEKNDYDDATLKGEKNNCQ